MTTISAQAILVSRNAMDPDPHRKLCTVLCRYPRWIHSELMTHRAFSRNAASSRAIPVEKMIKSIIDDPAIPLFWGSNKPGMQAGEECNNPVKYFPEFSKESGVGTGRREAWLQAMFLAIDAAKAFNDAGYHKQIVNRLIEPFMHITTLISATEWSNFFHLRIHEAAEPHIKLLAERIKEAIDNSPVQFLNPGEWHLPFVTEEDMLTLPAPQSDTPQRRIDQMIKLSVARCASTSYKTVGGFDMTLERAIQVHDKLAGSQPMHASPCEHVALADQHIPAGFVWQHRRQHRNFVGFRQYRAMLPGDTQ